MKRVLNNRECTKYIANRWDFRNSTGSLWGQSYSDKFYQVFSYNTIIAEYDNGVWFLNDTTYSVTTSKQQGQVRYALCNVPETVTVVHVPFLASRLSNRTGKVARERAQRIRKESNFQTAIELSRQLIAAS